MEHPCQSSQYPWDKSTPLRKDCRLRRIGRLPHGFLTKSVTTLLPVDLQLGTKPYCIKSLWTNLCWRRLAIQLLPLSTSSIVKHPCSGTSSAVFVKATRFKRHTFCLNSNTVRSFHVCTVGENKPLKRLDSAIDHNNHPVILLKSYFSTAIAIPLLSSLWEERLMLNCSRMFHA